MCSSFNNRKASFEFLVKCQATETQQPPLPGSLTLTILLPKTPLYHAHELHHYCMLVCISPHSLIPTKVPGQNKFSLIVVKQFLSVSVYCADELLTFYRWSKPLYSWPRMWPWQMHALVVSGVSVVPAVPGWPLFFIKAHSKWDYTWWAFFESFWLVDEINYFPMIPGHFACIASLKYLLSFIAVLWLSWPSPSFLLCMCRTRVSILFHVVQKMLRTLACIIICISHGFEFQA